MHKLTTDEMDTLYREPEPEIPRAPKKGKLPRLCPKCGGNWEAESVYPAHNPVERLGLCPNCQPKPKTEVEDVELQPPERTRSDWDD